MTLSPDNSRWYSLQVNDKNLLPYNAPGYKWGLPRDGLERPGINRAANDPTAVYLRVKQIEKSKNKVIALLKTNTKILVQTGYKLQRHLQKIVRLSAHAASYDEKR